MWVNEATNGSNYWGAGFINWGQVSESWYRGWPLTWVASEDTCPGSLRPLVNWHSLTASASGGEQSQAFTDWSAGINTIGHFGQDWPRQLLVQWDFKWTCFYLEHVCFDWIWRKAWGGSPFGKQTNYVVLCCLVGRSRMHPQQHFMEGILFPVEHETIL